MDKKSLAAFIICVAVCVIAGIIGSIPISGSYLWYEALDKPAITPPTWLFGPIWGVLYALMGISLWLIIRKRNHQYFSIAFVLFIIQLVLNVLWTYIFFGARAVGYAYIEILVLDALVLLTVFVFGKISRTAQWLMLPYVIWLGLATYLNWHIMYYNQL